MCGIAGVGHIALPDREDTFARLGRVIGAIRKRGPDGLLLFTEGGFSLAQTFLLISDQSGGAAPYLSEDHRFIAVVNGQIYNHHELRQDPNLRHFSSASASDCEILANGFAIYGPAFFARIQGMFALAILDRVNQTLTLARDAQGIRPLYYSRGPGGVAFCSEPQPLVNAGLVPSEPDDRGSFEALLLRNPIEPRTMFRHVRALPPGHFLTIGERDCQLQAFVEDPFAPQASANPVSASIQTQPVRAALTDAVSARLPRACRYATFLSGGLDSGIVAALTPSGDPARLASPVCGFEHDGLPDERIGARALAAHLGLPLQETTLTPDRFLAIWPLMLDALGAPLMFNSTIAIYWMARQVRRAGGKVLLSGEGADELFLGYPRYAAHAKLEENAAPERMLLHDEELGHLPREFRAALQHNPWWRRQFKEVKARIAAMAPTIKGQSALDRKLRFDRLTYLRGLLMRQDRAGLGAAVEIRVPFLDEAVVSAARAIPSARHLVPRAKAIPRELFRDLLGPFADAPKIGFPLPMAAWMETPAFRAVLGWLADAWHEAGEAADFRDALKSIPGPRDGTLFVWTLANLAAWSLLQRFGPRFFAMWHDQLQPTGQSLLRELQEEMNPGVPGWLPALLRRGAGISEPTLTISRGWLEPARFPLQEVKALPN